MRMANAFYKLGPSLGVPILLAGTDQPDYGPELAYAVSQKLSEYDAVLGPACDGGYYLLAFSPAVYRNKDLLQRALGKMEWSHDQVLHQQQERFAQLGIKTWICPQVLQDIDSFADLYSYQRNFQETNKTAIGPEQGAAKLSLAEFMPDIRVVLPVLNEAQNLAPLLERLKACAYFSEIICADNGSDDGSIELAQKMGVRVTHCKKLGYGSTCLEALADIRKPRGL